jgi:hypothetical protein
MASIVDTLGSIIAGGAHAFNETLAKVARDAHARGYEEGKRAGREELRAQLAAVLADDQVSGPTGAIAAEVSAPPKASSNRLSKGTVAPAITSTLAKSERGLKPLEISEKAGIPRNSARGGLNKLRKDGVVEKRGALWFLAKRHSVFDKGEPSQFGDGIAIGRPREP